MINQTISHYKIISKLGSGGMGEVYLAEDTKLERKVALKFLPSHFTSDEKAVERFKREARAAAKLNHPNIVTIFEIGEHDGDTYIAMEYVDGISLREKIVGAPPRGRPKTGQAQGPAPTVELLSIEEITDIATQICEGLHEAHKAEITHRDIKSENILIDKSGRVKLLDFGLAQMKGVSRLTLESSTVGTAKYMSPEQYKAADIDHRTDIFSFGVILFEMLTGQWPFQGEYEAAVMYSVMNEEPKSVESFRPDTSLNLKEILSKCLEKAPADRHKNVKEILTELKKTPNVKIEEPELEKSIIVLPFDDMSQDKDNEYFSDGLTEEIITDLSHIHDLLVISRSSAMTFKGTKMTIPKIVKLVNVQYVLEGSVRKAGNNLRITAQLIDAATDAHLWAEKYSGTLDDVFDIQEKVSRSIVDSLKVKLTPKEDKKIAERPIDNVQAYECYLKATQEIYRCTEDSLERALKYLQNGHNIVGENILIYAGLGHVYYHFWNLGIRINEEYLIKSEEYANKIFKLDPDSPHGHFLLGLLQISGGTLQKSIWHLQKTLAIETNHSDALSWLSHVFACLGKTTASQQLTKRLSMVDPFHMFLYFTPATLQMFKGRFESALKEITSMDKSKIEEFGIKYYYSLGLLYACRFDEAISYIDQFSKGYEDNLVVRTLVLLKLAVQGKKQKIQQLMTPEIKLWAEKDFSYSLSIAEGYSLINEINEALNWLENTVDRGFINYPFLNEHDPFLENIRGEERFKRLMERVKHEWENFSA